MEYLAKEEVMKSIEAKRQYAVLMGMDTSLLDDVIRELNVMYSFRPSLQSQWIRKGECITCAKCGFKTLVYKNTKYCPECGRSMANGKKE